jgi:hypothetical protein
MFSDWQRTQRFQKKNDIPHTSLSRTTRLERRGNELKTKRKTKNICVTSQSYTTNEYNDTMRGAFTPPPSINPATKRTSPTQNSNKYSKGDPWVNLDAFLHNFHFLAFV